MLLRCVILAVILTLLLAISTLPQAAQEHAKSASISLEDVLTNTLAHHPTIIKAASYTKGARGEQLAASGAFDWELEQESFARSSGFYDGWLLDQRVSRRLPIANASVSAGYRISDGSFPIYEDINRTLSGGEANISLRFSLLRDREIDKQLASLSLADASLDIASERQKLLINDLLLDASLQFVKWQRDSDKLAVYEKLLSLAKERQLAIEQKIALGEVAQITQTEFAASLLQRQADLIGQQQKRQVSAIGMSFYFRDQAGVPIDINNRFTPSKQLSSSFLQTPSSQEVSERLQQHPNIRRLQAEITQINTRIALKKNNLKPELDAKLVLANDIGTGSQTLQGFESYVGLEFSMPLGQRVAKGELAIEEAKLMAAQAELSEKQDALDILLEQSFTRLKLLKNLRELRDQQALVATRLMNEEKRRFEAGDSNLFLLNTREADFATAQLAAIDAQANLLSQFLILLSGSAMLDERTLSL